MTKEVKWEVVDSYDLWCEFKPPEGAIEALTHFFETEVGDEAIVYRRFYMGLTGSGYVDVEFSYEEPEELKK